MDTQNNFTSEVNKVYDNLNSMLLNPMAITIIIVVFCLYLGIFFFFGSSSQQSEADVTGSSSNIIFVIVIGVVVVLAIINGVQYYFGSNVFASISNIFSKVPTINLDVAAADKPIFDLSGNKIEKNISKVEKQVDKQLNKKDDLNLSDFSLKKSDISSGSISSSSSSSSGGDAGKQVFNIPNNIYTYDEAKAVCSAFGSKLATYDQIEDAYKSGGEWCNYGWSEDQMILFPTQKDTWNTLQGIEGHQNDCGRPGINGGRIENTNLTFGVNCYGPKPNITKKEEDLMANVSPYPKNKKDIEFENRVDYWKEHVDDILISPFNHNSWSKY
jgi:Extracellular link domain